MTTATPYLKRFEAWVTGLRERYKNSFFFRLLFARDILHHQKLFISNVAHELRTPLAIIKTEAEVALLDDTLPRDARVSFGEIVSQLNRISSIIDNLLSLSALARPERMRFEHVDLGSIVHLAAKRHRALASERGISLRVNKEGFRTVWGNPVALEQVVYNLVKNALYYTPKNQGSTIDVSVRPVEDDMVLLCIADSGIGIDKKDLAHIFEPFYRADTSRVRKVKKGGSGLGLTIVDEIMRAHRGKIKIESKKRKGTKVSLYLPGGLARSPLVQETSATLT